MEEHLELNEDDPMSEEETCPNTSSLINVRPNVNNRNLQLNF